MAKYKVLLTDTCFPDTKIEEAELAKIDAELILAPDTDEDTLIEVGRDCDGVIFDYAPMTERVLSNLPKCKVAARVGIGLNVIDIPAASRSGIMVANVPDYCIDEVSDHAVALYLACQRKIVQYNANVKTKNWDVTSVGPIHRMRGQNFCLYGFGNIAQRVAAKVKAFGFNLFAYDPYVADGIFEELGVTRVKSLKELAGLADVLSIHAPLTEETEASVDIDIFREMKEAAIVINTSRGPLINEADLIEALKKNMILAAGLDVVSEEPLPDGSELYTMDNVIITPHVAFLTVEAEDELRRRCTQEVIYGITEGQPRVFVNKNDCQR